MVFFFKRNMEKYQTAGSLVIQYFEFWILSSSVRIIYKCHAWIPFYSVYRVGETDNVRIFFTF